MGFKKTSETIAVSFGLGEVAPNTFIQEEIGLQLDILNNEVFVVLACDLNVTPPDALATIDTDTFASVTSTQQTAISSISNSNCIAVSRDSIRAGGFVDGGVAFSRSAEETYAANVDYIAIVATNNFFLQLKGTANLVPKNVAGRIWGYRARADSATYAALVQSEVLSA